MLGRAIAACGSSDSERLSTVAKKKKVRVALRKNRQKRTRANDLTRSSATTSRARRPRRRRSDRVRPRVSCRGTGRSSRTSGAARRARRGRRDAGRRGLAGRRPVAACQGRVVRVHGLI